MDETAVLMFTKHRKKCATHVRKRNKQHLEKEEGQTYIALKISLNPGIRSVIKGKMKDIMVGRLNERPYV